MEPNIKTSPHSDNATIDHVRDGHRQFVIAPENKDLFVRTGLQVIAACDMQLRIDRWLEVYEAMLGSVRDFAEDHASMVLACYAVPRQAKTVLAFVPKTESFNFDLADELARLQLESLQQFASLLGSIEVSQVPSWDLERFVDLRASQQVYSD